MTYPDALEYMYSGELLPMPNGLPFRPYWWHPHGPTQPHGYGRHRGDYAYWPVIGLDDAGKVVKLNTATGRVIPVKPISVGETDYVELRVYGDIVKGPSTVVSKSQTLTFPAVDHEAVEALKTDPEAYFRRTCYDDHTFVSLSGATIAVTTTRKGSPCPHPFGRCLECDGPPRRPSLWERIKKAWKDEGLDGLE